jgi:AhpD family alkylhydroperoxidase
VADSGLDKQLTELIKIRVSQINGCAFCLQYHLNLARKLGTPVAKVDLVATWAEASIFSARERAALAWAETLTTMATRPVGDAGFDELLLHFTMQEAAHLTASIGQINAWNRIAGGLRFAPPIPAGHLPEEAGT